MTRVIIADDNEDFLGIMKLSLEPYGFEVKTVNSKKDLFSSLNAFHPDVVLLDVFLDKFDGRQLCREISDSRKNDHIIKIIFSANPYSLSHFELYGANDFIEKPIMISRLVEKIENLLHRNVEIS